MGYVMRRIEVYRKSGDGWDPNATVLDEASYPEVSMGWGKIKDSFQFTLPNAKEYFGTSETLSFENLVRIFLWRDSLTFDPETDLVMEGTVQGTPQSVGDGGNTVSVTGFNFSETFFDNQIPLSQTSKTWVDMLRAILTFLNGNGVNGRSIKRCFWHPDNPSVKHDGSTSFPSKTLIVNYMTVSTMIDRLTSDEFTEDGQYVWFVRQYQARLNGSITSSATSMTLETIGTGSLDIASELPDSGHCYIGTEKIAWTGRTGSTLTGLVRGIDSTAAAHTDGDIVTIAGNYHLVTSYKNSSTSSTITQNGSSVYEETSDIRFIKDRDQVRNFVIFNAGTDLYGVPIENFVVDLVSLGKVGYKSYYSTEETQDVFVNAWNKERFRNPSSFSPDADGIPTSEFPSAYNYTFEDGTVATSNKTFNDHLRSMAEDQGRVLANNMIEEGKNPRYSITYSTRFTNDLIVGNVYNCAFPSRLSSAKPLRVLEVRHSVAGTDITLDEDTTTATVGG